MQIEINFASESHVPRFRAGVGTWRSGYMIPIRLPWRHRARPSATLHEIQSAPKGKLVPTMLHSQWEFVNGKLILRNLVKMTYSRRSRSAISLANSAGVVLSRCTSTTASER